MVPSVHYGFDLKARGTDKSISLQEDLTAARSIVNKYTRHSSPYTTMASRDAQFDGDHETDMSQSVLLAETSHSLIETSHWQKGKVVVKRCRNHSDPRTFTRFHNEVDALRLNKNRVCSLSLMTLWARC